MATLENNGVSNEDHAETVDLRPEKNKTSQKQELDIEEVKEVKDCGIEVEVCELMDKCSVKIEEDIDSRVEVVCENVPVTCGIAEKDETAGTLTAIGDPENSIAPSNNLTSAQNDESDLPVCADNSNTKHNDSSSVTVTKKGKNLTKKHKVNIAYNKWNEEIETDPVVLARRKKQIDYGKNTDGYRCYTQKIPKNKRGKEHPQTPPINRKYSRRNWDGLVRCWRLHLHEWDPPCSGDNSDKEFSIENKMEKKPLVAEEVIQQVPV